MKFSMIKTSVYFCLIESRCSESLIHLHPTQTFCSSTSSSQTGHHLCSSNSYLCFLPSSAKAFQSLRVQLQFHLGDTSAHISHGTPILSKSLSHTSVMINTLHQWTHTPSSEIHTVQKNHEFLTLPFSTELNGVSPKFMSFLEPYHMILFEIRVTADMTS